MGSYALKLLVAALIGIKALTGGNANAGDFATRNILGFSENGDKFAFEEYGIQDGSGFAYSNIYVIDTTSDSWTSGSPFRVQSEDEAESVESVRAKAKNMAAAPLAEINQPGVLNATNQPLEIVENPHSIIARPWFFNPPTDQRIEFRIDEFPLQGSEICESFGATSGFRLTQIAKAVGQSNKLLHEDAKIPSSRNCPLNYRFADIVTYQPSGSNELIAAILILYETVGFEGPDGRYLAVTTRLAD